MSQHFTHLHVHTDYSLLDGAIALDKLVAFGKENKLKALAITDHGNVFGAVKFFEKCAKAGIKPILGIEAYLTEDVNVKEASNRYYHIIILVENTTGYKNLCKLISFAYQKGFYFKPRIDYAMLEAHSEGLIVTSGCLGGHIPQLLKDNKVADAERMMDWYLRVFGPERFYLEVQPEDQPEQAVLNAQLYEWSAKKGIPLVATADCHYVSAQDREAHEIMLCIQTQHKITDTDRFSFGACRVHLRTEQEMLAEFKDHPEAVYNSGVIADRCNFQFETGKLFFPDFKVPEHHTAESFFIEQCWQGLDHLFNQGLIDQSERDVYNARLDEEINLIVKMGFIGYFLIVSDFIKWAKANGIPVGPGRGSAAGSLIAWALSITNLDPIKYNLLFERFLNPERITMPDIDIDFCIDGREKVIDYVRNKYGHDKVGQIITFGTMMAKGVVKDVARVLGIPFEDANALTNLIPEQLKITLHEAMEQEPRLKEMAESNPHVNHLFSIAFKLEGLTRHASKHAAGIVITPEPIDEILPVYIPPRTTDLVTQYAMTELESIGFLKIDFLGLKNLTLIDHALHLIKQNHGIDINLDKLPLDDSKTFQLLQAGSTSGVFQLESEGIKDVLRKLMPEKFEDIIAVNALYRPGPLGSGMVDDFIERKHGRQKITYLFPELAPILKETYGVIVYQEQVMKIASTIAGYSLGESDILRRAMGKKKAEVMEEQRLLFLQRSAENQFNQTKAGQLFDLMAYFAGYGFNKSHSAAYALIAYQTAYLKAHYPAEFMACLISLESTNAEKMSFYLHEAKEMNLEILPPSINHSEIDFSVKQGKLLFGLKGIKNVGLAALEQIVLERKKRPFVDLLDFCTRVDMRTANKRVIESLIYAGAFDELPGNRAQQYTELSIIMDLAIEKKRALETGQLGLFDQKPSAPGVVDAYVFAQLSEWDSKTKLEKEKEVIGFYISAHPLDMYQKYTRSLNLTSCFDIIQTNQTFKGSQEPMVAICGLITQSKTITTKKGDPMAFVQLEDHSSKAEIIVFPKLYKVVEQWLKEHHVFVIKGNVDITSKQHCKIKAQTMIPAELFFEQWPAFEQAAITLPPGVALEQLHQIKGLFNRGSMPIQLIFHENGKQLALHTKGKLSLTQDIFKELHKHQINIAFKI